MASEDFTLISEYAATGSAEAFAELVRRHAGMVFTVAKRITGNAQDAEDVAQDCFWALVRNASRLKPPLVPWLHRLATCRAIDHLRQRNTERWRRQQAADLPAPDRSQSLQQLWPQVDEALLELPEAQRRLLIRHFLEGASQAEVAEESGISQPTTSRRIEEALAELRKVLARRGTALAVLLTVPALASLQAAELPASLAANLGRMALAGVGSGGRAIAVGKSVWLIAGAMMIAAVAVALSFVGGRITAPVTAAPAPVAPARTVAIPAVAASPAYPLKIGTDRRHLVDQHDAPFLWVGDTAWSAIAVLTPTEMDAYLDDRKAKGFSVVQTNLIEHKFAAHPPANAAGESPFTATLPSGVHDFAAPNPAYFATADLFLRKAAERGICVLLKPAHLGYGGDDQGWFAEMKANSKAGLRAWGRWLGDRYRSQANIIWMHGGDYTPPADEQWIVDEVAQGIRDGGGAQLMTAGGARWDIPSTAYGARTWFDLNAVYAGLNHVGQSGPRLVQDFVRTEYARTPVRPLILLEGTIEAGPGGTPDFIRRQAYASYLCGGCGQDFVNNPVWSFGTALTFPATGRDWRPALDTQGARDMARLAMVLRAQAWWKLEPDSGHTTLVDGFASGNNEIVAARAADGSLVLVYVPANGTGVRSFTIDLARLAGPVTARWFNPARGGYTPIAGSPLADHGRHTFATAGDNGSGTNDWLLVLTMP